jgi:hypothetical protein
MKTVHWLSAVLAGILEQTPEGILVIPEVLNLCGFDIIN